MWTGDTKRAATPQGEAITQRLYTAYISSSLGIIKIH